MKEKRFEKIVEYYRFDESKTKWIIFALGVSIAFIFVSGSSFLDLIISPNLFFFELGIVALFYILIIWLIGYLESRYVYYREIK